jgi:hypothetical protein
MIFHILTAVLFLLKILDVISISWWLVLAPSLVMFTLSGLVIGGVFILSLWAAWGKN